MKIAIHPSKGSFSDYWIDYCDKNGLSYKFVDCYSSDIIQQLGDCDALMWHFSHNSSRAMLFSRQLLYSVQAAGKKVFPDFNTVWHFDDKLGQKYLLEAVGAPLVPSWIFYNKNEALQWVRNTDYPKVFKLRGGAGSQNVYLINTVKEATKLIYKAFGRGFLNYDAKRSLKERWRMYKLKKNTVIDLIKGLLRFVVPPPFADIHGREKGYVYFQEFIKGNNHDIRVVVIDNKAFAIKRLVRENDFRASGSGNILYSREQFDEKIIQLAFQLADRLKTQCAAFDFVRKDGEHLVLEVSYGFTPSGYDPCPGYWDSNMIWHEGKFDPYGWMVEMVLKDR